MSKSLVKDGRYCRIIEAIMPIYLYRVLKPGVPEEACPVIEYEHSWKETPKVDPMTGYPLKKVYTAPNLSKGYSEGHTKQLLSDKNIEQHGFTKYVRDPIAQNYVRTAGKEGPGVFSVK